MNATPEVLPDTRSFLNALAEVAEARKSRAGAFIWAHADLILACVHEGYFASQIYRALDALGFHPPMSERQFRRYVRQLKPPPGSRTRPPAQRRARAAATRASADSTPPSTLGGEPPLPSPRERLPSHSGPSTFDWDPMADVDDLH